MKLTDIIKLCVTPVTGYEMEPDQVVPNGAWAPTSDGKYERSVMVKDIIGTSIRMKTKAITKYNVSVFANNNSWGTVSGSGDYNPGETAVIGAVPNTGYKFSQWQDGNTDNPRNIQVTGNLNFIANFMVEQVTYTIQVAVKSGQSTLGTVVGGGTGLTPGSEVRILAIPNEGSKFVRWNDGSTEADRVVPVNGNKTYTAEFTTVTYSIQVNSNNTTWGTVTGSGTYSEGTQVNIAATAKAGYRFVRWSDGNTQASRTITVTGIAKYTAYFEVIPPTTARITVKSKDSGMGYTNPSGTVVYNIGEHIMIQAFSNPGFKFVRWEETGTEEPDYEIDITGNETFTAIFEPIEGDYCTVRTSCDPANTGTLEGQGSYMRGAECTLKAEPAAGYVFVAWKVDEELIMEPSYTFVIEKDVVAVAMFEKQASVNAWDVFIRDGSLWIINEATQEEQPLNNYGEMQGDTLYFDASTLAEISEGVFTMSYTDRYLNEVIIDDNGIYPDFNLEDQLIESIITVTDMVGGDHNTAKYAITVLNNEQRDEVTAKYLDGDEDWWKLDGSEVEPVSPDEPVESGN